MSEQAKNKHSFLQNDRKFVCSMLIVYGLCILALIAATIWGLSSGNNRFVARLTEQAQYAFVDTFDNNRAQWETASTDDEYMSGSVSIKDGAYVWELQKVKQTFARWADFPAARRVGDFDVYVDTRVKAMDEITGGACSGIVFRESPSDREAGAYVFAVCNFYFYVDYHEQGKWEAISGNIRSRAIRNSAWNRVEISARGDQFAFLINQEVVYEMTDDRLPKGGLGLFALIKEKQPVTILFDNFGVQLR
jgi:Domain of Unknown Function (DUF1080)